MHQRSPVPPHQPAGGRIDGLVSTSGVGADVAVGVDAGGAHLGDDAGKHIPRITRLDPESATEVAQTAIEAADGSEEGLPPVFARCVEERRVEDQQSDDPIGVAGGGDPRRIVEHSEVAAEPHDTCSHGELYATGYVAGGSLRSPRRTRRERPSCV